MNNQTTDFEKTFVADLNQKVHEDKKLPTSSKRGMQALFAACGLGVLTAGGFALMGFTNPANPVPQPIAPVAPVVPNEPAMATGVSDSQSFGEAFATAREEVGAGGWFMYKGQSYNTYYKEEFAQLSPEQKQDFCNNYMAQANEHHIHHPSTAASTVDVVHPVIVIPSVAPIATSVDDSMTFNEAFVAAREEVGAGGIFTWHNETFNTYSSEEMSHMNTHDRDLFQLAVEEAQIPIGVEVCYSNVSYVDTALQPTEPQQPTETAANNNTENPEQPVQATSETFVSEDYVDDGEGGKIHVMMYLDPNGQPLIKADPDNDGHPDFIIRVDAQGATRIEDMSGHEMHVDDDGQLTTYVPTEVGHSDIPLYDYASENDGSHHDVSQHDNGIANDDFGTDYSNNDNLGMA